ncbi:phage tail protein [Rhodopseudomonas palustris]|uniref:Phage tail protein n=1 Tax=Rhodopseudomonas palustris TaxID=1076 RepID=A0A323UJF6_RHOPL|nr:phage tail protein [Rhodopseudomonas palustris]PZA12481.1 phage tail protein [Rhodopseudomonas palustris]
MALMAIGGHIFQAIGLNGQSIETSTESNWVDVPRFGMVDSAQMHGWRRAEMSIRGVLYPDQIGGLADYEAIRASQYGTRPLPLLRMGRGFSARVIGAVTIERVSDLEEYGGKKIAFTIDLKGHS